MTSYTRYLAFLQLVLPDFLDSLEQKYFLSSKELGQEKWMRMVFENLRLDQQQDLPKWNFEERSKEESSLMPGHLL